MGLFRAEAVVIKSRDFGEADRIITYYNDQFGKREAVAKGARRPRSRLAGATQVFSHVSFLLFSGKNLDTVSQAEIRESFRPLREDLNLMAHAAYFCELVDASVEPDDPHPGLAVLLTGSLSRLAAGAEPDVTRLAFEVRFLALAGFLPQLGACASCGAKPGPYFSPELGGAVCGGCREEAGWFPFSPGSAETVKRLLELDPAKLGMLKLEGQVGREVKSALRGCLLARIGRRIKSLDFLESLN